MRGKEGNVASHPPTAKVHHLGQAPPRTLSIGFPGAKTLHPWEKAEDFPGVGWGPHDPPVFWQFRDPREALAQLPQWPPGHLSKASTQPIPSPNAPLCPSNLTEAFWTQHLTSGPSSPLSVDLPVVARQEAQIAYISFQPLAANCAQPKVFSFMTPLYSAPAKKEGGVGTRDHKTQVERPGAQHLLSRQAKRSAEGDGDEG